MSLAAKIWVCLSFAVARCYQWDLCWIFWTIKLKFSWERAGTSHFSKKYPFLRQMSLENQMKNMHSEYFLWFFLLSPTNLYVILWIYFIFEILKTKNHIFEKLKKNTTFSYFFSPFFLKITVHSEKYSSQPHFTPKY